MKGMPARGLLPPLRPQQGRPAVAIVGTERALHGLMKRPAEPLLLWK